MILPLIKNARPTIHYMKTLLKDKGIASVTPSSGFSVRKVCGMINFNKDITIIECGPGNGVFSIPILKQMTSASRLVLIESNEDFFGYLSRQINDHRASLCHDNVINIRSITDQMGIPVADYILLGIPFSFSDAEQNHKIIDDCKSLLRQGGKLIIYQFSQRIKKYLRRHFDRITTSFEILNIPPLFIFEAFR